MIFRDYFLLLLLIHVVGDFYFQSPSMAEKKLISMRWVIIHCMLYWFASVVIILPVISRDVMLLALLASFCHMIIDVLKFVLISVFRNKAVILKEQTIFYIDQVAHIICLVTLAYIFTVNAGELHTYRSVENFCMLTGISAESIVSWSVALLIIHKPVNILIAKMLTSYRPDGQIEDKEHDNNTGRFIGTIERLIIVIFISLGQYAAIGLVLTAKSIARYDKITSTPAFAEYYLLGTLLSTAAAIIITFLL